MVDLVLDHPRQEPAGLKVQRRAIAVERRDADPLGPYDGGEDSRDREASFLAFDAAAPPGDGRVDERPRPAALVVVHEDQPERDADLGGGEADADLVVHGLDHVGDEALDLGRDGRDRVRLSSQDRIAVLPDFQDHGSTGSISTSMIPRPSLRRSRDGPSRGESRAGRSSPPFRTICQRGARGERPSGAGG